jgi:trans-aconitate methyltransferase
MAEFKPFHVREHDWHAADYVAEWIARDVTRDDERRPALRKMVALAPFAKDAAIRALDVGGGYGIVADEVLRAFPRARVTLLDYSQPMLDQARTRLAAHAGRVDYVLADLTDQGWPAKADGPFELAVSGIAIHNLRDRAQIAACYTDICGLLAPGGVFLDYDHVEYCGGLQVNLAALRAAGFASVEAASYEKPTAVLFAKRRL